MRTMNWKTFGLVAVLGSMASVIGCQTGDDDSAMLVEPIVLAEPVPIVAQNSGDSAAIDRSVTLIRTQAEYDALGDESIMPNVDYEVNDLVIVSMGQQPTGGYSVKITGVQLVGDELAVTGVSKVPSPDALVTQALTHPYDAVVIPNTAATTVVPYID